MRRRSALSGRLLVDTVARWVSSRAMTQSAALAFYTLISLAPVLLVAVTVAGAVFGEAATRYEIGRQVGRLAGPQAAEAVRLVLEQSVDLELGRTAGLVGIVTLLLAASVVFAQLQTALNTIWTVEPRPGRRVRTFLRKRLLSFGLVLAVGFVLLVSLLVSAAVSALGAWVRRRLGVEVEVLAVLDFVAFLVLLTALFALMFRYLPDARIGRRDVLVGAAVTALLFSIGKELIGAWLGRSGVASVYGVAGSVVLLLLWTYYSSMILLLGAAFTRVWSERRHPGPVTPEPQATRSR